MSELVSERVSIHGLGLIGISWNSLGSPRIGDPLGSIGIRDPPARMFGSADFDQHNLDFVVVVVSTLQYFWMETCWTD